MDSAESSPSSALESLLNQTSFTKYEESSTSDDEPSDNTMPVIADVTSNVLLKPTQRAKATRTSLVIYGPIRVRKRHSISTTIATGRRSKDTLVEGDDFIKRETRRLRNRIAAKKLKQLRDDVAHQLEIEITKLEMEEQDSKTKINTLHLYKQYLEEQCRRKCLIYASTARTASTIVPEVEQETQHISENLPIHYDYIEPKPASTIVAEVEQETQHMSLNVPLHYDYIEPKPEPAPTSPAWQLMFHI